MLSMQSPPASTEVMSVITLSDVLAYPGVSPRLRWSQTSWGRSRWWARVTGRMRPRVGDGAMVVEGHLNHSVSCAYHVFMHEPSLRPSSPACPSCRRGVLLGKDWEVGPVLGMLAIQGFPLVPVHETAALVPPDCK